MVDKVVIHIKASMQHLESAFQALGQHPLATSDAAIKNAMRALQSGKTRLWGALTAHEGSQQEQPADDDKKITRRKDDITDTPKSS